MQRAQRSLLIYVLDSIGCFPILSTAEFSSHFSLYPDSVHDTPHYLDIKDLGV